MFASHEAVVSDGGLWLREQCLILSGNNNTPVDRWLSMTLPELMRWIAANNAVIEKRKGASENAEW